jgi:hypothetical protein
VESNKPARQIAVLVRVIALYLFRCDLNNLTKLYYVHHYIQDGHGKQGNLETCLGMIYITCGTHMHACIVLVVYLVQNVCCLYAAIYFDSGKSKRLYLN